jgi:hypothetical protein
MTIMRDVTALEVPMRMQVDVEPVLCWVVRNDDGAAVEPIRAFVAEMAANGTSPATRRSYCHDLLRWWRFCEAIGTTWDEARPSMCGTSCAGCNRSQTPNEAARALRPALLLAA